jgi:DNA-directed RNA polymerase specialized sigma subunit
MGVLMKKYRDDVCRLTKCINIDVCKGLCGFLKDVINGNSQSKEILLSNLTNKENLEYKDYNAELSERSEDIAIKAQRRQEKLFLILSKPNTIEKFMQLAKLAGFEQKEIAKHCKLTEARISQIIRNAP